MLKYLVVFVFISSSLFADEKKIPSYLKDATITVTLRDGTIYSYSANDYAVIKRDGVVVPPPAQIIERKQVVYEEKEVVKWLPREKHLNRIRMLVGRSMNEVSVSQTSSNLISIKQSYSPFVGVGYERMVSDRWSLGLQWSTDKSQALTMGYDF